MRYSDAIVHLPSQASWRYMNADELKAVFHRDGFELTGYKGPDGTVYELTELNKLSELFDDGQLHMGKTTIYTAQWERIGNKTEDSSSYYTKADDGIVKIESVDQNELKKQLETDSTVQIDVSGLEAEKVTLPVSAGDALSSDQTEIIGDIEQGMVLDVSLTANGTEIHSFNGKVTVSVPFTWTQQGVLQAWYLADDGTKEPVEVAYRDGNAVLTLKHFSTYAIVVKANDPDSGIVSMGENEVTVQKQADAVYYAAALYAEDGRFLAYAASEAAEDEETVTLKWANADWSKAAKVKVFFLDADRKPVAEAVTALINGKSQKN